VPLLAALYFMDHALQTSLNLGFNERIVAALDQSAQNLRTLRRLDPASQQAYREQFAKIEQLQHVYENPQLVKSSVLGSLKIYFGMGLVAAVLFSIAVASVLGRSIARAYATTFDELTRQQERVRYLEEISAWQELAKVLAHEIKNPLTPIEVLITSLSKSYLNKSADDFQEHLRQTERMVGEELDHLKSIVDRFSEFAKLPQVQPVQHDVPGVLQQHMPAIFSMLPQAQLQMFDTTQAPAARANLDATLFRQVLLNIVRNGVEANPGRTVRFEVHLQATHDAVQIHVENDGVPVPAAIAGRIFDPYVSGNAGKENMGLGLAIVKKIIVEHGGDIAYAESAGRPRFTITLPSVAP
jgi:signal transduction histidine kinase